MKSDERLGDARNAEVLQAFDDLFQRCTIALDQQPYEKVVAASVPRGATRERQTFIRNYLFDCKLV